jgi:hypothetical protein
LLSEISEWLDSSLTSLTQAFTLEMQWIYKNKLKPK